MDSIARRRHDGRGPPARPPRGPCWAPTASGALAGLGGRGGLAIGAKLGRHQRLAMFGLNPIR